MVSICRRECGDEPPLVGEVGDDQLILELGPLACIADGDGNPQLHAVHRSLCDENATCSQASHLQKPNIRSDLHR